MAAKVEKVKNIVLVGQGGVGKTMLAEAMLHLTGRTSRLGGHAGTKPTLDYDAQESDGASPSPRPSRPLSGRTHG